MNYEEYEDREWTEGESLLVDGKPYTFIEHDECHGIIWIRDKSRDKPICVGIGLVETLKALEK